MKMLPNFSSISTSFTRKFFLTLIMVFGLLPLLYAQSDTPCECAQRWEQGAHWNANGTIDDSPNSADPHGIIRCGSSAETQSGMTANSCVYNSSQFLIDLTGHTCLNPNTLLPVSVSAPVNGCPITWINFDVRSSAGSYDYQIVTNDNIGWALYVSTEHQNGLDPSGLSGNCSSLTFWACGNSFNNTFATFTVPSFLQATNCYLAIWDQDCTSPTNYDAGDFSLNFKARFGCGDADFILCIVEAGIVTTECNNEDETYTVSIPINGANGNYQGYDPNATPTTSEIVTLKNLGDGGPTSGTIIMTYPQSVNSYNITIQDVVTPNPDDDIEPFNPDSCVLNVTGNAPVCCQTPTCGITGDSTICDGTSTSFTVSGGSSYAWSGPNNFSANTASTGTISEQGTYIVTVTVPGGCASSCSRTLVVNDNPICGITGDDVICAYESTSFTASGGTSYAWEGPDNFTANTANTGSISTEGTYSVTVTDANGCTSSCSEDLTVNNAPSCNISGDDVICAYETTSFTASGGASYAWSGPNNFSKNTANTGSISAAGTYHVTVTYGNGCTSTCERTLTVNSAPSCNISGDNEICDDETTSFTASGGTSYAWSGPNNFTKNTSSTGTISAAGTYYVTVTDANGCTSSCSRTLLVTDVELQIVKEDMSCRCYLSQNQLCTLDFAGLTHGESLSEQYAAYGIHVFSKPNAVGSTVTRPLVFNSNLSGTADPDLEVDLGNILIVPIAPGVPNDDAAGGEITFNFDFARTVLSFVAVDFDEQNCDCTLTLYDAANTVIKVVQIPNTGNGGYQTVPVNAVGVRSMTFKYNDSGAIADIRFACDEPCCDGSATANPSGGEAPYSYHWTKGNQQTIGTGATIEGLCPGTYYVTVTDENGCEETGSVTIENPSPTECNQQCVYDCNGDCNGTAYYDNCQQCVGGNTGNQACTPPCNLQVESLTLVYEGLLGDIGQLTEGTVINSDQLCRFNIRANTCPSKVGSVKFVLNNSITKIENTDPYAFYGDNSGSYKPWIPSPGNYTIVVTAYAGSNATGQAGTSYTVHFSVTGSQGACGNPPPVCVGGCNDNNSCTTDACVNGSCVYTPINCNDGDVCTNDYCNGGICYHDPVQNQPSYLRVVNPAKSWRKLKLGYSNSLWSPKQNVSAGGNNQMCITLRAVGTPEWGKIQVRPQGNSIAAVVLGNYLAGPVNNWTTVCIPLSAFSGYNFSSISFIEIPYSNGAGAFEIHIQKIEFTGGANPFLWFGDPHTGNYHDGGTGSTSALIATLVPGQACGASKLSDENTVEAFNNNPEVSLGAYPNPFRNNVTITFSASSDEKVRIEIFSTDGKLISLLFEGNVQSGEQRQVDFNSGTLANGMYFYRMTTESGTMENRKLILMR